MRKRDIRPGATYAGKPPRSSDVRRVTFVDRDGMVGYSRPVEPERLYPAVQLRTFARWAGRSIEGGPGRG